MAKTVETIATINSAIRTVLAVIVCGAVGVGGYYAYNTYHAKDIAAATAENTWARLYSTAAPRFDRNA